MSQADFAEFAGILGTLAGLVSFVVLGYVEVYTVPALIEQVVFHGDPSAGFGLGFLVVGAVFILIPANILGAAVIGRYVYKRLKEPPP
jgi:hypothetical protein